MAIPGHKVRFRPYTFFRLIYHKRACAECVRYGQVLDEAIRWNV